MNLCSRAAAHHASQIACRVNTALGRDCFLNAVEDLRVFVKEMNIKEAGAGGGRLGRPAQKRNATRRRSWCMRIIPSDHLHFQVMR